ncbi:MAG: hypothetical protein AAFZ15_26590 [Bacteroidota bacterium]
MHPIVKNILAVIAGLVVGSVVNIALVNLGPMVIPPPEGADITTMEGLKESMHLFKPMNFVFPFLGHALGTLAGAFVAAKIAATHKMKFAIGIGAFFLIGGIMMVRSIPGPAWFNILDIAAAYIPMGWLGGKWGSENEK